MEMFIESLRDITYFLRFVTSDASLDLRKVKNKLKIVPGLQTLRGSLSLLQHRIPFGIEAVSGMKFSIPLFYFMVHSPTEISPFLKEKRIYFRFMDKIFKIGRFPSCAGIHKRQVLSI